MKHTIILLLASIALVGGCLPSNDQYVTPERLQHGLVVILPGIEGEGRLSYRVRSGLLQSAVPSAIRIYNWGRPLPLIGPLINQMDVIGNRLAGQRIAQMIVVYQDSHPGKPVYIIGHSGGGGVAVFSAESMPDDRQIDGLILLSASISKGYNLTKALGRVRSGIVNFYSDGDVALLGVGTTLFGNVDGVRGPSAGYAGFDRTPARLYQIPWSQDMAAVGNKGGHADSTHPRFIRAYVADWVLTTSWPAN